ncbi:MAG TPA: ParB/RepB/Spo0J family partition protein [Burkholderiales bacterium]|nr:ParB/RepB/Spo0J family partition protein [Burkholderiales bacterium]
MRQIEIPLDHLTVSHLNARKDLHAGEEDSGIEELATSIKQQGLLSPLIVRPIDQGRYEVLVGQRRLLACQKIRLTPVPCLVREDLDDADAVTISLVENVHRAEMHPLDKARALKALYDRYHSYERVAQESAWSATTIRKYIQLLSLPEELQNRLSTSQGSAGVGTLSRLSSTFSGADAVEVFDKISGFKQSIQDEILKRSGGDISAIDDLVDEAQEGAFDMRRCGGAYGCEIIRDILVGKTTQSAFQQLVKEVAETLDSEIPKSKLREAARGFWKGLAKG